MAQRAYKTTVLILLDETESPDFEQGDGPPNLQHVKNWLSDAVSIDVDTEEFDDPHGFQSAQILFDELVPLSQEELSARKL